jgi:hypothetical protein
VLAQTRSPAYTVRGGTQVAVPFRPEVQADLASARRLAQANDYRTALPIYQMLLASDPADVEMSIEVARVLGFADRNAESAALYRRVVAMAPARRTELLESLAWQTLWGGDAAAAEPMFVELAGMPLTTQQRAGAWRGAAEARQSLGRLDDSLRGYDAAIALAPDDRALQRRRAQMLLWLDRHAESIAAYEALVAADPADRLTQVGLAQALNFSGQHRRALATWTEAGAPVGPDEQREVARGLAWAGFPDMAYGALQDATLPDAVFLRDWRVRREVRPAAWAAYEWSRDRDRLDTRALTLGTAIGSRLATRGASATPTAERARCGRASRSLPTSIPGGRRSRGRHVCAGCRAIWFVSTPRCRARSSRRPRPLPTGCRSIPRAWVSI